MKNSKSPLITACSIFCFDEEIVKIILKYSPNLELKDINGDTLLYQALWTYNFLKININIIKILIDAGVNVNTLTGTDRETILHKICNFRNTVDIDIFKLLLNAGVDPNQKDLKNKTALDYLSVEGNNDVLPIIDLFYKYNYNLIQAI